MFTLEIADWKAFIFQKVKHFVKENSKWDIFIYFFNTALYFKASKFNFAEKKISQFKTRYARVEMMGFSRSPRQLPLDPKVDMEDDTPAAERNRQHR